MLIFSHKIIIRCFCSFSSCCTIPVTSCLPSPLLSGRLATRHRNACFAQVSTYRYAVRTGIYVTFACRGFSFRMHPLSMHPSALQTFTTCCTKSLDCNRLPLVYTACRWKLSANFCSRKLSAVLTLHQWDKRFTLL